ncbi:MAG TPA: bifunctional [glutamate--ammonia ligase]-adenylyl-L-tyrosine phosphorylase/[glutamate--ammonia-ligase] adenylyltransferase [Gammaproteobacteria bacterium]|nr:bifunctional [glutamate--ammonia ligase]-adenylyl-L-tyrosine phosphorylase/[glutamate--ammonia-ligase] adenylyltransferase [Gammaproteobacteria bacterium]
MNDQDTAAGVPANLRPVTDALPAPLRADTAVLLQQLAEAAGDTAFLEAVEPGELARVLGASRFVGQWCVRRPSELARLLAGDDLGRPMRPGELHRRVERAVGAPDGADTLKRALREVRNRELVRIAWRDLARGAPLEETLEELSALAEACIAVALDVVEADLRRRWGTPRGADGEAQRLVVLGMGKLGGRELNFSSDIDLVFAFPEAGQTDGPRRVDNEAFFTRVAQHLIQALADVTAEGFVYRVDTRLRPFGESGPMALNFGAMEHYYESHGREWERYAFVKARVVAGDRAAGEQLLETLRPFVYRRYIDYGVIESLREMKALIAREVRRKGLEDDIKLGRGGIREVEFIGQVFQLIRGGHERDLQERGILPVLDRLDDRGLLAPHMAAHLRDGYRFLRRVENRLQAVADRQTHQLPADPVERARLAFAMGYREWATLAAELDAHRQRIQEQFDQVFASPQTAQEEEAGGARDLELLWAGGLAEAEGREVLQRAGMQDVVRALAALDGLRASAAFRTLSETGRARLARLVPLLIGAAGATASPDVCLERLLQVIEAIARRSTYLALLAENPMALSQLARLCAASPWITAFVARHPVLLDELLDPRTLYAPPERAGLENELAAVLRRSGDLEEQMDGLRRFQQASMLRVAAADITGNVPVMHVSDFLTEIAEVVLAGALELAWTQLVERYGEPGCVEDGAWRAARFAIAGYGKLGGLELGYGSDLDLVFLHDSGGAQQVTRGERSVDNAVFFARLAQRIIHLLSTVTPAGVAYEVDTRLRPSGRSGLLVTTLSGFETYQREEAWTWEHQALVRARVVAGAAPLADGFAAVRRRILGSPRDAEALRREVGEMRSRMRANLDRSDDSRFDLKQGRGGIADIEFVVQYAVLLHAAACPAVLDFTDNIRILERFAEHALLPEADCRLLADAYRTYRKRIHELSLQEAPALVADDEFRDYREAVSGLWQRVIGA